MASNARDRSLMLSFDGTVITSDHKRAVHMSAIEQTEEMSEGQFRACEQNETVSKPNAGSQNRNSAKQCDRLLHESSGQRRPARQGLSAILSKLALLSQSVKRAARGIVGRRCSGQPITTKSRGSAVAPASAPVVSVSTPDHCQHVITFTHAGARGAQPVGSSGAEIYICVRDECPVDGTGFRLAAWAIRSPHVLQFSGGDAGRTAHYRLRWINAKGESGPWSSTVTATIPALAENV